MFLNLQRFPDYRRDLSINFLKIYKLISMSNLYITKMSLRNLFDQANNQYVFSTVDASVLEINNVPISTGGLGTQNLQQVLNTGSNAGNQNITNLNGIQMNGYLQLTNSSINTVQLNTGGNSWQLVSSNGEFFIQNYVNSSLVSSSFQIDNDGNVLIGNTQTTTPYLYVMGGNGPGRVYDTIYNPLPSNPSGSSIVYYNKGYNVQSLNKLLQVVSNPGLGNAYINICQLNPTTDFEGSTHFQISINTIVFSTNTPFTAFDITLYLISNKTDLSTLTMNDINKCHLFQTLQISQNDKNDLTDFTISDMTFEFYDTTGINSMNLIALVNYSGFNVYLNSYNFTINSDNATYNYLPTQVIP